MIGTRRRRGINSRLAFILEDRIPAEIGWSSCRNDLALVDGKQWNLVRRATHLILERSGLTSVIPWKRMGSWPGPCEYPNVQTALAPLSS